MRQKGYLGEKVALAYLQREGYILLEENYTIRGGEIDLIVTHISNEDHIFFVEVKAIDAITDTIEYISSRKLQSLVKTMNRYMLVYPKKSFQLDLIFIKSGEVYSHIPNISYDV